MRISTASCFSFLRKTIEIFALPDFALADDELTIIIILFEVSGACSGYAMSYF
jgi:hypothetical protein